MNQCGTCGKQFAKPYTLRRHQLESCGKSSPKVVCNKCGKQFARKNTLEKHLRDNCESSFQFRKRLKPMGTEILEPGVCKLITAFKCRIATYRFASESANMNNYSDFLNNIKPKVLNLLTQNLQLHLSVKVNTELFAIYMKPDDQISDVKSMNTANKVVTFGTDLDKIFEEFKDEIMNQAEEFSEKESSWALQQIMFMDLNINKYSSISASSYIPLPQAIVRKGGILNIKNDDNKCFAYCINAAIFKADGCEHSPSSYPPIDTLLSFEGIEFPVKLKDIDKFEQLNQISVHVFGLDSFYENKKKQFEIVGPLRFSMKKRETHVNLLLITDDESRSHYCLITDLARLVRSQLTKHHGKIFICDGCLQSFRIMEKLKNHEKNDCTHIYSKLPTHNLKMNKCGELISENILKFTNIEKQLKVPFVIYADFESLLKPMDHNEPFNGNSYSVKICEHEAYSFAFYIKCSYDDSLSRLVVYHGLDAPKMFVKKVEEAVHEIYNKHLKFPKPMQPLTPEENREYESATICHICKKDFDPFNKKVRDHCHLLGKFRGAAHDSCNLNFKLPKFVPIFLHNLTNYDTHLFIKELSTNGDPISVIAQTKEKYITFSKSILVEKPRTPKDQATFMNIKFVDSFRFLSSSLEKLSETLDSEQCKEVKKYFSNQIEFNLMRRKGVFPYSYIDSFDKLKEKQLPSKDKFFDNLKGEAISDEDYERAKKVWSTFNCETLNDYGLLYLKSDVLLLADIFENFRKVCLDKYQLDPAHYLTAPALSWDAMLKYTEIELELLTDIDMLHFFKKGIRGGVAQCTKRKGVANNKFLPVFDQSKPESYIIYLDATNLYGAAMSKFLPTGGFRWLQNDEIHFFDVNSIPDESLKGYVLEVDLEYPTNLHETHNDLPFCPENMIPPKSKFPKLIPNLYNKSKYIIHYQNLKQCLKYGLKLTKIHRIIEFSQSDWLKKYIQLNTNLRNQAKNDFEKDLFKLLINAIFGKTMENVEKRQAISLCTRWNNKTRSPGARSLIAKPEFKTCSVFNENLVAIHLNTVKVVYDKPLYIGFSILDISKTIIYEFLYGYIKPKYGDAAKLLYTDTDSLILEVTTNNFYNDIKENIQHFDTSNYSADNVYGIPRSLSVVGKMKDEFAGVPIESFYGTGAKAYCVKLSRPYKNTSLIKKAKGVSKHVIKKQMELNDYIQVIEGGGHIFRKMYIFVSNLHTIYTELKNKVALSAKDDKRYIIPSDVNTLAWGHLLINQQAHNGTLDDLLAAIEEVNSEVDLDTIDDLFNPTDFDYNLYM